MALSSSNAQRQLSDRNSQGTVMGQASADLISFYGVSSVARPGSTGTSFASLSISSGALVSSVISALNALGLIQCSSQATA